jgi:hypothetical protein
MNAESTPSGAVTALSTIAGFCDCKVWTETIATGSIRYIFFGLPADVEAAHFLYDLIDVTFTTETTQFKTGAIYGYLDPDERRKAVNSFQIGLSHGIAGKLKTGRARRGEQNIVRTRSRATENICHR